MVIKNDDIAEIKSDLKELRAALQIVHTDVAVLKSRFTTVSGALGLAGGLVSSLLTFFITR